MSRRGMETCGLFDDEDGPPFIVRDMNAPPVMRHVPLPGIDWSDFDDDWTIPASPPPRH